VSRLGRRPWPELAGVLVAAVVCFHGVLLGQVLYSGDLHQSFGPLHTLLGEGLRRGSLLWTGRLHNGGPILANPVFAALYPPKLLLAWLEPARGQTLLVLLHLLWTALGTWLLARRWGRSRPAAWTAGAAASLNGACLSATRFLGLLWTVAWLPWLLLAFDHLARARRPWPSAAALALVVTTMLLAGEPSVLLAGFLGLALFALDHLRRSRRWRVLLHAVAAVGVAVLAAAPFLAAVVRFATASVRGAGFVAEAVTMWSLHPLGALELALPDLFGDHRAYGLDGFWAAGLVAPQERPLLAGLYLGALLLALVGVGTGRADPRRGPLLVWLALLLLLALGRHGPLCPLLLRLPGSSALRYPVKWLLVAMLPAALLAARGLDTVVAAARARGRSLVPALVVVGSLLALLAIGAVGASCGLDRALAQLGPADAPAGRVAQLARDGLIAGCGRAAPPLLAAMLAGACAVRRRRVRALGWAVAVLVGLDLATANAELVPTTDPGFFSTVPEAVRRIETDPEGHGRVWVDPELPPGLRCVPRPENALQAYRWQREVLRSYTAVDHGLDLAFTTDVEAMSLQTYAQLQLLITWAPARERAMLLGAAGVTHLVTFNPQPTTAVGLLASLPVRANALLSVYRNRLALPRVRVVPRLQTYDGLDGYLRAVSGGPDDLFAHAALLDRRDLPEVTGSPESDTGDRTARVTLDRGHLLVVRTVGAGGWLVVSDTLTPGWRAELDGRPTPLLRADFVFRAVRVPAGEHEVRMTYSPWRR
jgi:hypothetical protein